MKEEKLILEGSTAKHQESTRGYMLAQPLSLAGQQGSWIMS